MVGCRRRRTAVRRGGCVRYSRARAGADSDPDCRRPARPVCRPDRRPGSDLLSGRSFQKRRHGRHADRAARSRRRRSGAPFAFFACGAAVPPFTSRNDGQSQGRRRRQAALAMVSLRQGHDSLCRPAGRELRQLRAEAEVAREIEMKSGEIKTSLFAATDAAGIPDGVAVQLADIFGGDVDFHRDLRRGDRFGVVFETFSHGGQTIRPGRVLAAEFSSQRKTYRAVWFQDPWGRGGYYTPEGDNLRKVFLRSPLEFSRITSGFGMRRHPIFQEWRTHRGVDYGAPVGTRIKATGDGVVSFAG